ncbi:MAG: alanine--tRNA ligase, partial [Nitrospirae bacterium]|nr:alanine--tRNA ligase [Nitrospirota bacterium]
EGVLKGASDLLKARPLELVSRLEKLLGQLREQEKELERLKSRASASSVQDLLARVREIGGVRVLAVRVEGMEMADLRGLADQMKGAMGPGVFVLGSEKEGKVSLVAGVCGNLDGRFHAGEILKRIAPLVGGGGGGRPDMAQAGGKDPAGLAEALETVFTIVGERA